MLQIHLFSSSECTQLQTHTRTHSHMRTPIHTQHACSKSPFSVYASARRCTHIHSGTHTRTHPYTRMLLHAPEQCRIRMPRIHVFDSGKRLRRDTHTHTRMLVYEHKLYAPGFTCTHQNDVMHACPKSRFSVQGNASRCKHTYI